MSQRAIIQPQFYDSSFRFYNTKTGLLQHDIWRELQQGMWREFDIDAYLANDDNYAKNVEYKENIHNKLMFPNFAIIKHGHLWNPNKNDTEIDYTPITFADNCTRGTLMNSVENYFKQFEKEKIGVHLSGGLDSSIIMAWLKELGIPFVAIGFKSERWEFRTEHRVQDVMAHYADYAELIDIDNYPFYSQIEQCPKCQTPYGAMFKDLAVSRAMVNRFKQFGVTTVFSGQGGDSLFVDSVSKNNPLVFAIGDEFDVVDEDDLLYAPAGLKLRTPYSDMGIIQQISSLRIGQKHDAAKWWARRYFKDILPRELSEYDYVADMFGLSQSGLELAKPTIKRLFEETYNLTGNNNFSPSSTKKFLNRNVFELEFETYISYCASISVAVWIHALFRKQGVFY